MSVSVDRRIVLFDAQSLTACTVTMYTFDQQVHMLSLLAIEFVTDIHPDGKRGGEPDREGMVDW